MGVKGQIPWNKGKTGVYTKEMLERMFGVRRGRKHTEEHKRKISEANKGQVPWIKGKHHSLASRILLSKSHMGKHLTEEAKKKISERCLGKPLMMMRGKNHPRWKGKDAIYPFKKNRHTSRVEYKKWRRLVLEKGNYTCAECGSKENPQTHHIISWTKNTKLRYSVSNGMVLCKPCHKKKHKGQRDL